MALVLATFDGITYSPAADSQRLTRQLDIVRDTLLDHQWHTLADLAVRSGGSETSASARIRDLRKARFGGYLVERQRVRSGLWEYRIPVASGVLAL